MNIHNSTELETETGIPHGVVETHGEMRHAFEMLLQRLPMGA